MPLHRFTQARTPGGNVAWFGVREGTADGSLLTGVITNDEYRLAEVNHLAGWALDIGSYAGHVATALLADHPALRVIAVDPVEENCDILRDARNQWYDGRLIIKEAAAGNGVGEATCRYDYSGAITHEGGHTTDANYVDQNRFMAGLWRQEPVPGTDITVPVVSVRSLAEEVKCEQFVFCKIDCEGCEYAFLEDGAELIRYIVGEFHDGGPDRIIDLLSPTHLIEILEDHGGTGIFRAWLR